MTKQEKINEINAKLTAAIAVEKAKKEQHIADYYQRVAELQQRAVEKKNAATDDPEDPKTENPVVWINGKQWTCAVVARRILNKLPDIPYNCAISIDIQHYNKGAISLTAKAYNPDTDEKFLELYLASFMEAEEQASRMDKWLEDAENFFGKEATDEHVNEIDTLFGGNPLDDFPSIERKEADNE